MSTINHSQTQWLETNISSCSWACRSARGILLHVCFFWGAGCRNSSYAGDLLLRISTKCKRAAKKKKKKARLYKAFFGDWHTVSSTCMPLAKASHRAKASPGAGPHTPPMEVIGMNNLNNILTTHTHYFSLKCYMRFCTHSDKIQANLWAGELNLVGSCAVWDIFSDPLTSWDSESCSLICGRETSIVECFAYLGWLS